MSASSTLADAFSILQQEISRLETQVEQFHDDYVLMYSAASYGNPPGGWSDPERIATFQRKFAEAEQRHRDYDERTP